MRLTVLQALVKPQCQAAFPGTALMPNSLQLRRSDSATILKLFAQYFILTARPVHAHKQ